jgi:hypothetical protein
MCLGVACWLAASASAADPIALEVHEWSLWVVDPTLSQTNAKDHYPNNLPVFVESTRSRLSGRTESRPSPMGMITFYGEPAKDVEVELQLASSSRFYSHWPPAETKSKRARWLDLVFSAASDADGLMATPEEGHWFVPARSLDGALFLRHGARTERFLCYDVETSWAPQIKLTKGPDRYQIENLDKNPADDIFVILPAGESRRVGRLKHLPGKQTTAADKGKPAKEDSKPKEPQTAAAEPVTNGAVLAQVVVEKVEEKPKDEKPTQEKPAENTPEKKENVAEGAKDAAPNDAKPPEWVAEIEMSPPLAPDSETFVADTRTALHKALVDAGLKPSEAELLLSIYADQIFKAKEMVVLLRLPGAALDEQFPLVTYPDAKRIIRVPLILMRNADPQLQGGLKDFVARLGDNDYEAREKAEMGLKDSGRLAVPLLKEALKNSDPEVVIRAERLLLAQNESIDASSAVLPVPKDDKKQEGKDSKNADKQGASEKDSDKKDNDKKDGDVAEVQAVEDDS